jgi:hypothetical protein
MTRSTWSPTFEAALAQLREETVTDAYLAAGLDPRLRPGYVPTPAERSALDAALRTLAPLLSPPLCDWCRDGYSPAPSILCADCFADHRADLEERAAIAEYQGGLSRAAAEVLTWGERRAA